MAILREEKGSGFVCHVANLGDTRAVLFEDKVATRLSVDHKASIEEEKIEVAKRGGQIINNRLLGILAVTRALGDFELSNEVNKFF